MGKKNYKSIIKELFPVVVVFFMVLFIQGCKKKTLFHKDYFLPVKNRFDSLYSKYEEDSAIHYALQAYKKFPNPAIGDSAVMNRMLLACAYKKGDYATLMRYADESLQLLQPYLYDKEIADMYADFLFVKGSHYVDMELFDEAIKNFSLYRQIVEKNFSQDKCRFRYYYECVANLFYLQQNYHKAIENYQQTWLLTEQCLSGNVAFAYTQGIMDNLGLCYAKMEMWDSSMHYYRLALNYIDTHMYLITDDTVYANVARMNIYENIGNVYCSTKQFAAAEVYFLKGLDYSKKYLVSETEHLQILLCKLYVNSGQLSKAAAYFAVLSPAFDSSGRVDIKKQDFLSYRAQYYALKKDSGQSLLDVQHLSFIKDSLHRKNKNFSSLDIRKEFEYREEKFQTIALKKDNELKKNYLLISVIILLMAACIIGIVWYNLRKSGRHVRQVNRQNTELQHALNSLEQSQQENNRIIRVVAHDLRNPISAVQNIMYSLQKQEPSDSKRETMEVVRQACVTCLAMIRDLLNQKKQLQDIGLELTDLAGLLKQAVELLQIKANEKQQKLVLQTERALIRVNKHHMWRAVDNLVNNAIKFSPEHSEITIRLQSRENGILLSVHDRGIGIPINMRENILASDALVSREGTRGEESFGLGLSIIKKIVDDHHGKLWFESEPGRGSVFFIQLPHLN